MDMPWPLCCAVLQINRSVIVWLSSFYAVPFVTHNDDCDLYVRECSKAVPKIVTRGAMFHNYRLLEAIRCVFLRRFGFFSLFSGHPSLHLSSSHRSKTVMARFVACLYARHLSGLSVVVRSNENYERLCMVRGSGSVKSTKTLTRPKR